MLAASSLGSCLVFVSSAVVTVAHAAIGRDMRLSPLDLQWVMNAELLPLAALTLVAGALGDRFGQKRIFVAGIALYGLGAAAIGFAPRIRAGPACARLLARQTGAAERLWQARCRSCRSAPTRTRRLGPGGKFCNPVGIA